LCCHAALCVSVVVFFFSSRRRHTRFSRDWSSDVCSSDLPSRQSGRASRRQATSARAPDPPPESGRSSSGCPPAGAPSPGGPNRRSEERRVGKECRSRWEAYQWKEKTEKCTELQNATVSHR